LELNSYESIIVEEANDGQKLYQLRSSKEKNKFYQVDTESKTCSCPDFKFKALKCKHILATELIKSRFSEYNVKERPSDRKQD
jgi:predicted nucleic acid-binding Zn finger protein